MSVTSLNTIINLPQNAVSQVNTSVVLPSIRPNVPKTSDTVRTQLAKELGFKSGAVGILRSDEVASGDNHQLFEMYLGIREAVLDQEGGDIETVKDFNIDFNSRTAKYTDSNTGSLKTVDLFELQDPIAQTYIDDFFALAEKRLPISKCEKGSKGRVNGPQPFEKKTDDFKKKMSRFATFDGCSSLLVSKLVEVKDPVKRVEIAQRFVHLETQQKQLVKDIESKITRRNKRLKNRSKTIRDASKPKTVRDQAQREFNQISKELRQWNTALERLQSVDLFALAYAAAEMPLASEIILPEDRNELADKIIKEVPQKLHSRGLAEKVIGTFKSTEHTPTEEELAEAKDVAGLLFQDRWSYYDYCDRVKIPQKKEGVEDVLLRSALNRRNRKARTDGLADGFCRDLPEIKAQFKGLVGKKVRVPKVKATELNFAAGMKPAEVEKQAATDLTAIRQRAVNLNPV